MKRKILVGLFLLVSMLVIAKTITHDVKNSALNAHNALDGPLIIRSEVNAAQGPNHRWRDGDTVKLRQNGRTSTYEYTGNGNFIMVGGRNNTGGGGGSGAYRGGGSAGGSSGGLGSTTSTYSTGEDQTGGCEPWTLSIHCNGES